MTDTLLARLTPIFRDIFDNDTLTLRPSMTAAEVDGWDSLANIRLFVAIEVALGIRFSAVEISGLANVGALVALIERKLAG